jgi:hypothetical protein
MIIITSNGRGPDTLGVAYNSKTGKAQIQQDIDALARELGVKTSKPKISNTQGISGAEVRLSGVVDWSTRTIHLEPILRTFKRFPFLRVAIVFEQPFSLANMGEPIREGYRVQTQGGGSVIDYLLRRADGTEGTAGITGTPAGGARSRLPGWAPFALLGAIAIVVGGGVFWIARNIIGERRTASRSENQR